MARFRFDVALSAQLSDAATVGFGLGDDVDLSDPAVHREVCVQGWLPLEPNGAWNDGDTALLAIPLDAPPAESPAIWIEGDVLATAARGQVLSVVCDGVRLRPVCLRAPVEKVLRVGWPDGHPCGRELRVAIECVDLASPAALGIAPDERPLGFMVKRLVVTGAHRPRPEWLCGETVELGGAAPFGRAG